MAAGIHGILRARTLALTFCLAAGLLAAPARAEPATFRAQSASEGPFDLSQAVRYAVEHAPGVAGARQTHAIRELELQSAVARVLPSLDLSATHGLQNNVPLATSGGATSLISANPTAPWYSSLNLGLTENLYDNGASLTQISAARLSRDLAWLGYLRTRDQLALDVTAEFYRLSLNSALLEVKRDQESMLDKQLRSLGEQYHQGIKTRSDFLRIRAQTQRAEIDRIAAESAIRVSEAELRKLMGEDPGADASRLRFTPVRLDAGRAPEPRFPSAAPAFADSYDARIARVQDELNGKSVTLAEREYWPRVSLTAGIAYTNQNYLGSSAPFTDGQQVTWSALLSLQYNFWDWGIRRRNVQVAELTRSVQKSSLDQGLLDLRARLDEQLADLERLHKAFRLTQELLGMEEESTRNLQSQYREGKVTYLDLVTGLNNLLDARVQYLTSYFDALQGIAKLDYYGGRIYDLVTQAK